MRVISLGGAIATAAVLMACAPQNPMAAPELNSMFQFSAYPGARLVREEVYNGFAGPFARPGTSGYREYETSDPVEKVQAYYQNLGKKNGWALSAEDDKYCSYTCGIVTLTNNGFRIAVSRILPPTPMPSWTPPPDGTATPGPLLTSPTPFAGPSASASVQPSPTPSPSASPYIFRIDASSSHG